MHLRPLVALAVSLSLLPFARASDPEDARARLLRADARLSAEIQESGVADGLFPFLARDAVYLHPGAPITAGRHAIRDLLAGAYADVALILHGVAAGAAAAGDLGYTFGWLEEVKPDGTVVFGKYLAAWERDAERWRVAAFVRAAGRQPPSPPPPGAAVAAGYHGSPAPAGADAVAALAAETDRAFAALSVAEGYSTAFPAFADENVVVIGNRDFFWGKAWTIVAYAGWTPEQTLDWGPVHAAGSQSGDLAWTVGNATFTFDDGAAVERSYSKYLTLWARQPDGTFAWLLDAGNSRPGP